MESIDDFYGDLPSFRRFQDLVDNSHYQPVPSEWFVIVTDVKGSTKAIEEGRYRDVNTVGVASIVTTQNAMGGQDFPFVFGGDGATFLIPPAAITKVKKALAGFRHISKEQYGLELRVGEVTVGEILREEARIDVAKYEVVRGRSIAMFRGGGLALADHKIKKYPDKYNIPADHTEEADLTGLSCRWQPVPNKKGVILSLLALAQGDDIFQTYTEVLEHLNGILAGHMDQANPIDADRMKYKSLTQCLKDERKYYNSIFNFSFLKKVFRNRLCSFSF